MKTQLTFSSNRQEDTSDSDELVTQNVSPRLSRSSRELRRGDERERKKIEREMMKDLEKERERINIR